MSVPATPTLAVGAQWVTDERANPELVYEITKALYSETAQKALAHGHPKGASITLANAVRAGSAGAMKTDLLDPLDAAHSGEMIGTVLGNSFLGFALSLLVISPLRNLEEV